MVFACQFVPLLTSDPARGKGLDRGLWALSAVYAAGNWSPGSGLKKDFKALSSTIHCEPILRTSNTQVFWGCQKRVVESESKKARFLHLYPVTSFDIPLPLHDISPAKPP